VAIIGDLLVGVGGEVRRRERRRRSATQRGATSGLCGPPPASLHRGPCLSPRVPWLGTGARLSPVRACVVWQRRRGGGGPGADGERDARTADGTAHHVSSNLPMYTHSASGSPGRARVAPLRAAPRVRIPLAPSPRSTSILLAPCPRCSLRTKERTREPASSDDDVRDVGERYPTTVESSPMVRGGRRCRGGRWYAPRSFLRRGCSAAPLKLHPDPAPSFSLPRSSTSRPRRYRLQFCFDRKRKKKGGKRIETEMRKIRGSRRLRETSLSLCRRAARHGAYQRMTHPFPLAAERRARRETRAARLKCNLISMRRSLSLVIVVAAAANGAFLLSRRSLARSLARSFGANVYADSRLRTITRSPDAFVADFSRLNGR